MAKDNEQQGTEDNQPKKKKSHGRNNHLIKY